MSIFDWLNDKLVADRKVDEAYFAAAFQEFQSGHIRPGLMAKALTECRGDQNNSKAIYLRMLTAAIKDDVYIANRTEDNRQKNSMKQAREMEFEQNLLREKHLASVERQEKGQLLNTQYEKKHISFITIIVIMIGIIFTADLLMGL
tara:strand:- start:34 stop:471 length:438 start_codon:yes stop_codon:yes gene_type:complete